MVLPGIGGYPFATSKLAQKCIANRLFLWYNISRQMAMSSALARGETQEFVPGGARPTQPTSLLDPTPAQDTSLVYSAAGVLFSGRR